METSFHLPGRGRPPVQVRLEALGETDPVVKLFRDGGEVTHPSSEGTTCPLYLAGMAELADQGE